MIGSDLLGVALDRFTLFWLVFARVSGFAFTVPVLSSKSVPVVVRVGTGLLVALALLPLVRVPVTGIPEGLFEYFAAFAADLALGLALGFLVGLAISVAQVAGQILDAEMGLNMMNTVDPVFGQPLPLLGNFFQLLAALLFLVINGHHTVLAVLAESFQLIPLGAGSIPTEAAGFGLQQFSWMFMAAVRIAAPVLGALFLSTVALSFMARTAPQLNIFMLGVPAKIGVGLFVLAITMPVVVASLWGVFPEVFNKAATFLGILGGAASGR